MIKNPHTHSRENGNPVNNKTPCLAPARASLVKSPDGSLILKSGYPLGEYPASVPEMLHRCAERAPDSAWLAERPGPPVSTDPWVTLTYETGLALAKRIGQGLLELGARPDRPILALAANSIDFGLFIMAAMEAGIPIAPVTPAYGQKTGQPVQAGAHHQAD